MFNFYGCGRAGHLPWFVGGPWLRVPRRLTQLIYSWQRVRGARQFPATFGQALRFLCRKSRFYRKHVAKFAAVLSSGIVFPRFSDQPVGRERVTGHREKWCFWPE